MKSCRCLKNLVLLLLFLSASSALLHANGGPEVTRWKKGDRVLLAAFGGGFTWGAAVIEWANAEAAEAGREFLRLDCLGDNPGIRDYYEELGFEHRGDLVLDSRKMSLYERPVR